MMRTRSSVCTTFVGATLLTAVVLFAMNVSLAGAADLRSPDGSSVVIGETPIALDGVGTSVKATSDRALGPEITGVISDPSFETGTSWSAYAGGTVMGYLGYTSTASDGLRGLLIGPNNEEHTAGEWTEVRQTVDLTGVSTITFDYLKFDASTAYAIYFDVGGSIIWYDTNLVNPWARAEVNVAGYTGNQTIALGVLCMTSTSGVWCPCVFDNLQTWGPLSYHSISGTVTHGGSGLAGVTVKATPSQRSATTGADGSYTITDVPAGTVTITPRRAGYAFTPSSRNVTVGPDATGQDFTASASAGDGTVDYYAVICGISDYSGTSNDLNYCDDDANDVEAALLAGSNWSSGNIQKLIDGAATRSGVQSAISSMASSADADDVCLFFFSGHGTTAADQDGDESDGVDEYLVTHSFANISDDDLSNWLWELPTSSYVVILDTCFSGGHVKNDATSKGIGLITPSSGDGFAADLQSEVSIRDLNDNGAGVVLTAADDTETSVESSGLQNGAFTYYLVEGMAGPADSNSNNWISAEEAYSYTSPRATAYNSGQHAQLYDGYSGELDFLQLGNTAPTAPDVDVTPDSPGTGDDLTCTVTTVSTDADGDTVTYTYEWYKDSTLQNGLTTSTTALSQSISASNTAKGQTWQCQVTPSDGTDDGPSDSDQVTIGNTAPSVTSVVISPDPAYETDTLKATPAGWNDADGDTEGYTWQWQKMVGAAWTNITGATSDVLDPANFTGDDQIKVICTPWDGTTAGSPVTDEITIEPTSLVISNLSVARCGCDYAIVTWQTNVAASSLVGFDTVSRVFFDDYASSAAGMGGMQYHTVTLEGLTANTAYYLRARSVDGAGRRATSAELTFTTSALQQPTLFYTGDTSGTIGAEVTLAAELTCGGAPISGATVHFVCNNCGMLGVTAADGIASVTVPADRLGAGTHTVYLQFLGDETYLPAKGRGQIMIESDSIHTTIYGKGSFFRNGNRSYRCMVEFRFDADLTTGWLEFRDVRAQKRISVDEVSSIVPSPSATTGPQAVIVCGPSGEYTVTVNADTNAFEIIEGSAGSPSYEASTPGISGDIVIEEAQP